MVLLFYSVLDEKPGQRLFCMRVETVNWSCIDQAYFVQGPGNAGVALPLGSFDELVQLMLQENWKLLGINEEQRLQQWFNLPNAKEPEACSSTST
jgi:hypothetical protein